MKCHPTVTLSQAKHRRGAPSIYQNQKGGRNTGAAHTHTHTAEGFINQHPVIPQHGAASPFHLHPKPPQLKNSLLCFLLLVLQTSSETTSLRCFSLELIKFLKKDETVSKKRVQVVPKMLNVTGPQISWGRRWTCCDAACRGHVSSRVRTLC